MRDDSEPVTHSLDGDRSDLLSLCLGVGRYKFHYLDNGPLEEITDRWPIRD